MPKYTLALQYETPPEWGTQAISNLDEFLQEHASMERKASSMAMSFIAKYPDRVEIIPTLIDIALEELEHFRDVYKIMASRNVPLIRESPDGYINDLLAVCRHGRDDRFIDRMLMASIIESRGAERFKLVSQAFVDNEEMRIFYRDLWASEARHGNVFIEMLLNYYDKDMVYERLEVLLQAEAEVAGKLPWRCSLH